MSISAENEVKTAVLDAQGDIGADELVQLDATEDREILWVNVTIAGSVQVTRSDAFSLFLGSADTDPSDNSGVDNGKFQLSGTLVQDDTNGNSMTTGAYGFNDLTQSIGSVEWDEDESLSLDYSSSVADGDLVVEVGYAEK